MENQKIIIMGGGIGRLMAAIALNKKGIGSVIHEKSHSSENAGASCKKTFVMANGNIALLGDAAHPMTPDLGQGACQAMEDAFVLAECLEGNKIIQESLVNYENKRLKRVRSIAKNSFRMGRKRQMENAVGVTIRNDLLKYMPGNFALNMLERNIRTKESLSY